MPLKFKDEAERQAVLKEHAKLYRQARQGKITTVEMLRLQQALRAPYKTGASNPDKDERKA